MTPPYARRAGLVILAACLAAAAGLYLSTHRVGQRPPAPEVPSPRPLGDLLRVKGDTRVDVASSQENGVWRYRYTLQNRCSRESGLRIRSWFVPVDSRGAPDIRSPRGWECRAENSHDSVWKVRCRALASEQEVSPGAARSGFEVTLSRENSLRHGFGIRFHDGQGFESGVVS